MKQKEVGFNERYILLLLFNFFSIAKKVKDVKHLKESFIIQYIQCWRILWQKWKDKSIMHCMASFA